MGINITFPVEDDELLKAGITLPSLPKSKKRITDSNFFIKYSKSKRGLYSKDTTVSSSKDSMFCPVKIFIEPDLGKCLESDDANFLASYAEYQKTEMNSIHNTIKSIDSRLDSLAEEAWLKEYKYPSIYALRRILQKQFNGSIMEQVMYKFLWANKLSLKKLDKDKYSNPPMRVHDTFELLKPVCIVHVLKVSYRDDVDDVDYYQVFDDTYIEEEGKTKNIVIGNIIITIYESNSFVNCMENFPCFRVGFINSQSLNPETYFSYYNFVNDTWHNDLSTTKPVNISDLKFDKDVIRIIGNFVGNYQKELNDIWKGLKDIDSFNPDIRLLD